MQANILWDLCSHINRHHGKYCMMHTTTEGYLGAEVYHDKEASSYIFYILYKNYKKIYECHCKKIEKSF